MTKQPLTEGWALYTGGLELRRHDTPLWIPVGSPGPVWRGLLEAGVISDPAWRDERHKLERELRRPVTYRCVFRAGTDVLDCGEAVLRIDGLQGPARVELNGMPIGRAEGLRRVWEFPVAAWLRAGENCLTVELRPDHPGLGPVELLGVDGPSILGVRLTQRLEDGRVVLGISPDMSGAGEYSVTLTGPDGDEHIYDGSPQEVRVEEPKLWWPRGYGEQPLYSLEVAALDGERETGRWRGRIGLRTVELDQGPDGEAACVVNGVKVFAMGACLGPEGPRGDRPEGSAALVRDCAAANFNCLRVPGGRTMDEGFYDECDRLGIMVWQDMLPSLGDKWELTRPLADDIRARGTELGRRLGHRACVVLICGGVARESQATHRQMGDYIRVYEYILPKALWDCVPGAQYLPSSPVPALGEPGCSCLSTLLGVTAPEDRRLTSRVMEGHMEPGAASRIMRLIQEELPLPGNFAGMVYASQLAQAWAVAREVEKLRRERGCCMGALCRQVDEGWPGASGASIDYAGQWKALHYALKRAFAPVAASCQAECGGDGCAATVWVMNETIRARQVLLRLSLRDPLGQVKGEETVSVSVPALSCIRLEPAPLPEAVPEEDLVSFELYESGRISSRGTATFVPVKHYPFRDPGLNCRREGDWLVIAAKACALGVEIDGGPGLVLSDNYFDMMPGERWVKMLRGEPGEVRLRSVYDIAVDAEKITLDKPPRA